VENGNDNRPERPVILVSLAHPDDESFGMGGTLALYARRGALVYLVCATRGEAGIMAEEYLQGYSSVAERREAELRCAAEKLGLAGVFFLDYRDSGMAGSPDNQHPQALVAAPLEEVAGKIVAHIRRLRPHVVITFDPIGGYKHPDHIMMHKATVRAFHQAGDPSAYPELGLEPYQPAKLYYHTMPATMLRLVVRVMPLLGRDPTKFGQNKDINLKEIAETRFPTHAVIDYRTVSVVRDQAASCHASQGAGAMTTGLAARVRRWFGSRDTFMRAYPPPRQGEVERDLLEGIDLG